MVALRHPRAWITALSIIGFAAYVATQPSGYAGLDFARMVEAGQTWRSGGDPYSVGGYLYAPPVAALASFLEPAHWAAWAAMSLALVVVAAPRSAGALLLAMTWPGVLADITLGNTTIPLVAVALVALSGNAIGRGLPLGVCLALVPKPMFVMVVLWICWHERQTAVGIFLGAALATVIGVATLGIDPYAAFVGALTRGVDPHFVGNSGLSYVWPFGGFVAWGASAVVAIGLLRRREDGLMAAALSGTFAGTYVGLYSTVLTLAILPRYLRVRPTIAAAISVAAVIAIQSLWLGASVALVLVTWTAWRRGIESRPSVGGPASEVPVTGAP